MRRTGIWLATNQWSWAAAGSLVLWMIASLLSHHISTGLLLINATLASFLVLVGLGQMVVVTSGDGSFDLSLPYVVTLSAFVSGVVMSGSDGRLFVAICAGIGTALVVGLCNGIIISALKVPPVIATLATGYIAYSVILELSGASEGLPARGFRSFALDQFHGVSPVAILTVVLCGVMFVVLSRSRFGYYLAAMGQGRRAARLAGIPVTRMVLASLALSALMGGIAGVLLDGFDGGAFFSMGDPYLLGPLGAVVIGGTLISGGRWSVAGTMAGGLFLTLLVTVMEISKLPIGYEDLAEGLVVIGFVIAASVVRVAA